MRRPRRAGCAALVALLLAGCAAAPALRQDAPELAGALQAKPATRFSTQAVAAAHPLAAAAGLDVLRAGGSAVDAAVAVQAVLGLVEPQSSGIGGGAFLMLWDGRTVSAWDGRETAPAAADEQLFLDAQGRRLDFDEAVAGGRAVGVPGALRMLEAVQRAHGRLPWARLFDAPIRLADEGFELTPRLHLQLQADPFLRLDAVARELFYDARGDALPVGTRLRNPDYAAVLRRIADQGADALHRGPVAERIVQVVRGHARNPGRLSAADLAGYRALRREPLCHDWRRWRVCGFPPPSSGAIAIGQILGLLERRPGLAADLVDGGPSADFLFRYAEASRLAFADRAQHVADPAFVPAPGGDWQRLLDARYLDARARLIGGRAMDKAPAGSPDGELMTTVPQRSPEVPATSQVSIVDAQGQAVSLTATIEAQFGSRLMVNLGEGRRGGFLLNNQLTDFSFAASDQGRPVANRVQPGKRPRSSMSPTLVFERASGRLVLVTGSPGGAPIIHYTAKTMLATLAWGLDAQPAAALPNFGSLGGPMLLEEGRFAATTAAALTARGSAVREQAMTSGVQLLLRRDGAWHGGADPRREGVVLGD